MKLEKGYPKRGKRIFVGILVMALLVTMLPLENMGSLVSNAAETTPVGQNLFKEYSITPESIDVADVMNTDGTKKAAEAVFVEYLQGYTKTSYPNGIILKLTRDLDFSGYSGINFWAGNVGIDLNGCQITGLTENAFLQPETMTEKRNLVFIGGADGTTQGKLCFAGTVRDSLEYLNEGWYIYNLQNVAFSNVTLEGVDIIAESGASIGDDGIRVTVPSGQTDEILVCYRQGEGVSTYNMVEEEIDTYYTRNLYLTDFKPSDDVTTYDIYKDCFQGEDFWVGGIYYDASILASLPSTVSFRGLFGQCEYSTPTTAFQVDPVYGFYGISEDEKTLTIYGVYGNEKFYMRKIQSPSSSTNIPICFVIYDTFMKEDMQTPYERVIFAEGAIPDTYEDIVYTNYVPGWVTHEINDVLLYDKSMEETTFQFEVKNRSDINIYNKTESLVTFVDDADAGNVHYVTLNTDRYNDFDFVLEEDQSMVIPLRNDPLGYYGYYVAAGSKYLFVPKGDNTVYNLKMGALEQDDTGNYIYKYGRRADTDHVVYYSNGSVEVTIPDYAATLMMYVEPMIDVTADADRPYYVTYGSKVGEIDGGAAFKDVFQLLGAKEHLICNEKDGTSTSNENKWASSIKIAEEGTYVENIYYLIDQSMVTDANDIDQDGDTIEKVPSDTYGKRSFFTYIHALDLASPIITDVEVKDGKGNTVEIGEWIDGSSLSGGTTPDTSRLWINSLPLTLTVTASDTDASTVISGYSYTKDENGELIWNYTSDDPNANVYTITENGNYNLQVYVRDEFDEMYERDAAGRWAMNFGIDTTAPSATYTDADTTQATDLVSNTTHNGNLYLTISDELSGFAAATVYKNNNGKWEVSADSLKNGTVTGVYYIAPEADDVIYKIVVTDNAGNQATYENITVAKYTQDISVKANNATTKYNETLDITISITNTGDNPINGLTYETVADGTDSVFGEISGTFDTIAKGETKTFVVTLPAGTNVEEYVAIFDIDYNSTGGRNETNIAKVYNYQLNASIQKADGNGSIRVENAYYGETLKSTSNSTTNTEGGCTIYYKDANDANASYTTTVPTAVGTYDVKAVFPATANYNEVQAITQFTISRMKATQDMYSVEVIDAVDGWSKEGVVITALDGYTLSTTENGVYEKELTISESVAEYTFYIKTATGAVTEAVVVNDIKVDRTMPEVQYSDAVTQDGGKLVSGGTHEGNLYLTISDSGAGVGSISLYKKNADGAWVAYAEGLKTTSTTGMYYIAPTTEDAIYKIEVADKAGNVSSYENITVKGYTQDLKVQVEATEGTYGKDLVITIIIQNLSKSDVIISNHTLRADTTDSNFGKEFGSTISSIPANETRTTTITLSGKANAGSYLATLDIEYMSDGEKNLTKVLSHEINAIIKPIAGTGTISAEDFYYGETFTYKVESATNGTDQVTLYFREAGNENAVFSKEIPTKVGKYEVKAVFAATQNYNAVEVVDEFSLLRASSAKEMYTISNPTGLNGWYTKDVIITAAEGYTISSKEDGTFENTLTIQESVDAYRFYVKTKTGAITEAVVLPEIKIDKTAPEIADGEGIYAVKTWWQKFLEVITFHTYEAETDQIEIKAHDNESDIAKISYYISTEGLTQEKLEAVTDWTEGTTLTINKGDYEQFVIYAKIENKAGLITYISTDGIKLGIKESTDTPANKIISGVTSLKKGTPYQLEEGTWTVSGDTTTYMGGITFYVDEDGEYEFKKQGGQVNE